MSPDQKKKMFSLAMDRAEQSYNVIIAEIQREGFHKVLKPTDLNIHEVNAYSLAYTLLQEEYIDGVFCKYSIHDQTFFLKDPTSSKNSMTTEMYKTIIKKIDRIHSPF